MPTPKKKVVAKRVTATAKPIQRAKSGKNSDAYGMKMRDAYIDAVQNIRETSETRKDVWDAVNLIAKAGKKYKQDPTKDIANWKKFVKEVTPKDVNPAWNKKK